MSRLTRTSLVLAVSAAILAACGADSTSAVDPAPEPQPTASTAPATDAIRAVDFATQTWHDTPRDQQVTLAGDEPVGDVMNGGQHSLGETPVVYADVNGDGFEDALAVLRFIEGNGLDDLWYVWLWDEDAQAPRQLTDPVARQGRCDTAVTAVVAADDAFRIEERHRELVDIGACDDEPPHAVTRTIAVEGDRPVQREGHGGYGGVCPQPLPGDVDTALIDDIELFAAPDTASARVAGEDISWVSALPTGPYPWLDVDGWLLVGFGPGGDSARFDAYGPYVPCAWMERRS